MAMHRGDVRPWNKAEVRRKREEAVLLEYTNKI
jgi:hypothetical protein